MNKKKEAFNQNLKKLEKLLFSILDDIPLFIEKKKMAMDISLEIYKRIKLLIQQHSEDKTLILTFEEVSCLCELLLQTYVIVPELFNSEIIKKNLCDIKVIINLVDVFVGKKQSTEIHALLQQIGYRVDLIDEDEEIYIEVTELISLSCKRIFLEDKLLFIKKYQQQKIADIFTLLEEKKPGNPDWIFGLTDLLADLDSSLVKTINDLTTLEERLKKIAAEIKTKNIELSIDEKNKFVSLRGQHRLSPTPLKLLKYLFEQHHNGKYWISTKDIESTLDINIRNAIHSNSKDKYPGLFDFKLEGRSKNFWRINF